MYGKCFNSYTFVPIIDFARQTTIEFNKLLSRVPISYIIFE